jgi:small subunit ribosomal protein S8
MNYNDTISDMLTKIRNCNKVNLLSVKHINSIICNNILNVLYEEGYIRGYTIINKYSINILLKYIENKPVINNIIRISKPGRKIYYSYNDLLKLKNNNNNILYIISTNQGIISSNKALSLQIGGEILLKIK